MSISVLWCFYCCVQICKCHSAAALDSQPWCWLAGNVKLAYLCNINRATWHSNPVPTMHFSDRSLLYSMRVFYRYNLFSILIFIDSFHYAPPRECTVLIERGAFTSMWLSFMADQELIYFQFFSCILVVFKDRQKDEGWRCNRDVASRRTLYHRHQARPWHKY